MKKSVLSIILTSIFYLVPGAQPPEWVPTGDRPDCDTVRYPLPGSYTLYHVVGDSYGYVAGNNSTGDKAKANLVFEYPSGMEVKGVLFDFAIAKNGSGSDPDITFAIWDNTGDQGSPGALKASATKPLSQIVQDVNDQKMTYIEFSTPVPVTDLFYAGVVLPVTTGDTLALWTNRNGDVLAGEAWEQWSTGTWIHYYFRWELAVANAIFPVMCTPSNDADNVEKGQKITVYPNPTSSFLYILFGEGWTREATLRIINSLGIQMETRHFGPGHPATIPLDLTGYSQGLYLISIETGGNRFTQKIRII
jgi:hypothetical protein